MTDIKSPQPPNAPLLPPAELAEILRATAAAKLFDRFGRPILLGCDIELHGELPPVYSVVDARPNLTADAPGVWNLILATQITVICRQGQRHSKMTVVAMPPFEQADAARQAQTDAAATDAPAPPGGSIILTDMDKSARQALADAMPDPAAKTGPKLVPPAVIPDEEKDPLDSPAGAQFAEDHLGVVPEIDHGGEL